MKKGWFPNLNSAVMAWATPTDVFIIGKRIVDYKTIESMYQKNVKLFRVPSGQQLDMKREGQRAWNNETVYADVSLDLNVDDIIIFQDPSCKKYRIMNKTDWSQFGFIEYQITSDYQ